MNQFGLSLFLSLSSESAVFLLPFYFARETRFLSLWFTDASSISRRRTLMRPERMPLFPQLLLLMIALSSAHFVCP